jgi:pseudouridine synthase
MTERNEERLQKILANAGVASRRAAEEMIAAGRVRVNGEVVTEMGVRADAGKDRIEVDGKAIAARKQGGQGQAEHVYIALNKPVGVVTTAKDTHGRRTVLDLLEDGRLREKGVRVYPVGRLDAESTGLLLLTDDGDLTFRVTHPRYGIEKEYRALVRGHPTPAALGRLRHGVEIEGEMTAPAKVEAVGQQEGNTWLRITIHEGRKRQVRLMAAGVGHPVIELQRVRFGPLSLGSLAPGKWRFLAVHEVQGLYKAVGLKAEGTRGRGTKEPRDKRVKAPVKDKGSRTRVQRVKGQGSGVKTQRTAKP